jgi:hypothetical protein
MVSATKKVKFADALPLALRGLRVNMVALPS